MFGDWYKEGQERFIEDIARLTGVDPIHVREVYSYLIAVDFIDYDFEKEYLWDLYYNEED